MIMHVWLSVHHKDVKATMIYTNVLNRCPSGVWSPVNELLEVSYADQHNILS